MANIDLLPLWQRAKELEFGLAIRTKDKKYTKVELYKARQSSGDRSLDELILISPDGDELFIVKKTVELDP